MDLTTLKLKKISTRKPHLKSRIQRPLNLGVNTTSYMRYRKRSEAVSSQSFAISQLACGCRAFDPVADSCTRRRMRRASAQRWLCRPSTCCGSARRATSKVPRLYLGGLIISSRFIEHPPCDVGQFAFVTGGGISTLLSTLRHRSRVRNYIRGCHQVR